MSEARDIIEGLARDGRTPDVCSDNPPDGLTGEQVTADDEVRAEQGPCRFAKTVSTLNAGICKTGMCLIVPLA
ncbi:hypothetical protein [Roseobacter ponti]|uniref:Uncharacterized protein n=1 Tax=Roseobacter ponti TaxID=1891787 RepID=A0A858SXN4_9RHOB|nr:hypothetical protein [Roseobacter ponti]QJF52602.1 hypothetical protein G3256_16205 [Roseobacter ponti]